MRNIKLLIEYDGTNYIGWQRQPSFQGQSIQGLVENALKKMVHQDVRLTVAGRTDAGVHALGQVANFFTYSNIPVERFPLALKGMLPEDIVVKEAKEVPESFHAQFSAQEKTYGYTIRTALLPSVFERHFTAHMPLSFNIKEMKKAGKLFLGTHDFKAFCSRGSFVKNFVRTISQAELTEDQEHIYFKVTANGFVYNMVRIMVGTLVEIGRGYWTAEEVLKILAGKERKYAGPTAPPQGLCLLKVRY